MNCGVRYPGGCRGENEKGKEGGASVSTVKDVTSPSFVAIVGYQVEYPSQGKAHRMYEIMSKAAGIRVGLDKAGKLNFGVAKDTLGRNMDQLDLEALKVACRSDVMQTDELWRLYSEGKLKYPERHEQVAPANPVLDYALAAGFYDPEDLQDMSDGEQPEYIALVEGGGDEGWAADMFGFDPVASSPSLLRYLIQSYYVLFLNH